MSAHEHEPDTFTVSLEGQDGRKIDVSRQEFYGLIRAGSTILKCPACDETFTTTSAEDLNRNTRALFDHAKAAHGYSGADLREANIVCKVVPHCPRCHGPIPPATSGKIDGDGPGRALSRTSSTEPVSGVRRMRDGRSVREHGFRRDGDPPQQVADQTGHTNPADLPPADLGRAALQPHRPAEPAAHPAGGARPAAAPDGALAAGRYVRPGGAYHADRELRLFCRRGPEPAEHAGPRPHEHSPSSWKWTATS